MSDKLRAAAEMALDALERLARLGNGDIYGNSDGNVIAQKAMPALRQALAEPEQKPVAYMGTDIEGNPTKFRLNPFGGAIALYTKEKI